VRQPCLRSWGERRDLGACLCACFNGELAASWEKEGQRGEKFYCAPQCEVGWTAWAQCLLRK